MTSVIMSYLTIAAVLVLPTSPVLVPAIITAGHAIMRRTAGPARAATYRPTVSRRVAVPAATYRPTVPRRVAVPTAAYRPTVPRRVAVPAAA